MPVSICILICVYPRSLRKSLNLDKHITYYKYAPLAYWQIGYIWPIMTKKVSKLDVKLIHLCYFQILARLWLCEWRMYCDKTQAFFAFAVSKWWMNYWAEICHTRCVAELLLIHACGGMLPMVVQYFLRWRQEPTSLHIHSWVSRSNANDLRTVNEGKYVIWLIMFAYDVQR